MKDVTYVEPAEYFPEDIRKKHKLGEYSENESQTNNKQEQTNE